MRKERWNAGTPRPARHTSPLTSPAALIPPLAIRTRPLNRSNVFVRLLAHFFTFLVPLLESFIIALINLTEGGKKMIKQFS